MDMSSLFPADAGMGNVLNTQPTPHVSFKAGMLTRNETTNLVTADERKGIFQIITSPEEGLTHVQWRARNQSTPDPDLIVFNGDTEMKRVSSCPAAARVYVLKWREADKRVFFWMQGKDPSADEGLIAQVNAILENGAPSNQQVDRSAIAAAEPVQQSAADTDVVMDPPVVTPERSEPPAPAAPEPAAAAPADSDSALGALAPLLRGMPISPELMRAALLSNRADADVRRTALLQAQREAVLTTPTISELLNPDTLKSVLEDPRIQAQLPSLLEHLPEQDRSVDRIPEILRSPPLRSQAAALSNALQSGQASELIRSFELPNMPGEMYGLLAFIIALKAFEAQAKESEE